MKTQTDASSSAFEQINKNLINNIRGKHYLECLGAYCWMKANAVFTDEYEISIGAYRKEVLNRDEISYSMNYLSKAWNVTDDKVSSILEEMEKLNMIKRVRAIKGATKGIQYVYKINNKLAETANQLAETRNKLAETRPNNNTNNNTKNEKKKETNNDAPVCHSETFPASADVTNESQSMPLDDKSMTINKTNETTMTKEDLDLIEALSDDPMFNECPVEASMRKSNDYEELDDNAYYDKYGKNKPLTNDYEKARSSQIYSELFQYESILKQQGKQLDEEALKLFKNKCSLKPSVDEIKKAAKSIHSMQNTSSMKRKAC